jgi:hypothetical protein
VVKLILYDLTDLRSWVRVAGEGGQETHAFIHINSHFRILSNLLLDCQQISVFIFIIF